jgi:hypothetical protein
MLGIKIFKVSPEFDSLSLNFYFPNQPKGLCGAKIRLTANNTTANIGINTKKKVVVVI